MRHLGQHFLENKKILEEIVSSLAIKKGDVVIEIGPGHGELTEVLGDRVKGLRIRVLAIEKDKKLANQLRNKIEIQWRYGGDMVEIIEGDALKILPPLIRNPKLEISHSGYKIAGNIPYYITGHLLRILSELEQKPKTITLLIQKEVAERIVAKPPRMNLLAAVTQSWAVPKIIRSVGRREFSPPPKVDSAVITLSPKSLPSAIGAREAIYYEFIRALFKQPRKTILNNLANTLPSEALAKEGKQVTKNELIRKLTAVGINPNDRPQNLSLKDMQKLFKTLYNEIK